MANKPHRQAKTDPSENMRLQTTASNFRICEIVGWGVLVVYMSFGLFLESLHLFKSPFYFEVEIRRELWVLAHAHGVLLAILNIVFATWARGRPIANRLNWAGRLFSLAAILMPAGFLFGGLGNSETDPSLAILATPMGAACAIAAACLALWSALDRKGDTQE